MHVFRDDASIREAVAQVPGLSPLLTSRLSELTEHGDYELHELLNVIVAEPGDRLEDLGAALGFPIHERPVEAIESHHGWFELTYVLCDDGFGLLVYVPKSADMAPEVLAFCTRTQAERQP